MFLTSVLTRTPFPQAEPTRLSHGELEVKEHLPINSSPWDGLASLSWGSVQPFVWSCPSFSLVGSQGMGPSGSFMLLIEAVEIKSCCPQDLYGVPLQDLHL